ncbi:MAG: hypothetical protein M0P99_00305 [Candidatus Cloacimonetes bacterium]|nr:hypothetical protein [Candidatus Cloacimonadota bacterium]
MAETIIYNLDVNADESVKTLAKMEERLTEMKSKLKENTEVGTKEFRDLANEIKLTEGKVKNLNMSFEGLDAERITSEFGRMASGITAGITAVAVLGDDANESMEQMVSTVATGMAIAQGFRGAAESVQAATKLWTLAQVKLNAAMSANPIGLIVLALGAAAAAMLVYANRTSEAADSTWDLADALTEVDAEFGKTILGEFGIGQFNIEFGEFIDGTADLTVGLDELKNKLNDLNKNAVLSAKAALEELMEGFDRSTEGLTELEKEMNLAEWEKMEGALALINMRLSEFGTKTSESKERLNELSEENTRFWRNMISSMLDAQTMAEQDLVKLEFIEVPDEEVFESEVDKVLAIFQNEQDYIKNLNESTLSYKLAQNQKELEMLENLHEQKRISEEAYEQRKKELIKESANFSVETEKWSAKQKMQLASMVLSQLNQVIGASFDAEDKSAKYERNLALVQANIQIASGVLQALSSNPPPYSYVLAGITGVMGAIQNAKILSAELPTKPSAPTATVNSESKFASGGLITGIGNSTSDNIPILVSPGESVINAKSTAMYGDTLSAINEAGGGDSFSNGTPIFKTYVVADEMTSQQEANKKIMNLSRL